MLLGIEYSNRKNNHLKRLFRNAGFEQPEANIMYINCTSRRKLIRELFNRLTTCEYISEHQNLFITGAIGCGKTYMVWKPASSITIPCMNGCFLNQLIHNWKISLNYFIGDVRNHQPSFAHSMYSENGTTSLEKRRALWQMPSLTVSHITVIKSTSQTLMLSMTCPCVRRTA